MNFYITCSLSESHYVDIEGGQTFWNPLPDEICNFNKYEILYEGFANKTYDNSTPNTDILYSLTTQDVTFVLTEKAKNPLSNLLMIRTEHPKLLILEITPGTLILQNKKPLVQNMDLCTFINSTFIYIERHIRNEVKKLHHDVLAQKFKLEQVFKNTLILATQAPDEFAYHLMKGPGYMSIIAGEVVHTIKSIPIEVKYRKTKACYLHLPIYRGN